ncbi:MAG: ribokinase [Acholeplasma sp.]|nr:ribokinase [Acholeplasma sp.]
MIEKQNKIYVLGSINIDLGISVDQMPIQGETKTGSNLIENVGGKGANQAVSAARLGCETTLIGAVGDDLFGIEAKRYLAQTGLDLTHVSTTKTKTGLAFITRSDHDNRIILYKGANHSLSESEIKAIQGNPGDVFITQFEIPLEMVKKGLKKAKSEGMITILNPAPASDCDESIYKYVDYFVINQTESQILSGIYPHTKEDVKKVFDYFNPKGINRLIVTLGSEGSVYHDMNKQVFQKAISISPVDTTGAGDAFVGGLACSISKHFTIEKMMAVASAAGAHACLHLGVKDAMGTYDDILKIMEDNNE